MKYLLSYTFPILLMSFSFLTSYTEIGKASYYATKFDGKKTSSGEVFSQELFTAAHKTIKFGTLVKITNLINDSTVIVKVNDRLSKNSGHSIDLSLKAAHQLNFVRQGNARVKIETMD